MQKVGVILEITGKKAIVMTNRAEFVTVKNRPEMFVGQQITLNAPSHQRFDVRRYRYSLGGSGNSGDSGGGGTGNSGDSGGSGGGR